MALRVELAADPDRGPGYGRLRVSGLDRVPDSLSFFVQRNQGAEPFLGRDGRWVTQQAMHRAEGLAPSPDGEVTIPLGPALIDPIAILPPNCMLLVGIEADGNRTQGRVTRRGLLPSAAAGEIPAGETGGTLDASQEIVVVDPPGGASSGETAEPDSGLRVPEPEPGTKTPPPPHAAMKIALGAGIAAAVLAVGLFAAGLPPFDRGPAPAEKPAEAPVAEDKAVPAAADKTAPDAAAAPIDSRAALARYLETQPAAEAAVQRAEALASGGRLDFAMLVYQYAARRGSVPASMALGYMYDPETWSRKASPMDKPDAETAAYWYEPAAKAGNAEAQRRLGKILLGLSPADGGRDRAKSWLEKAAGQGDAEAKTLLDKTK